MTIAVLVKDARIMGKLLDKHARRFYYKDAMRTITMSLDKTAPTSVASFRGRAHSKLDGVVLCAFKGRVA